MAQKECTATLQATSSFTAEAGTVAYLWCTTQQIQVFLDQESTIVLGDTYGIADAKRLENAEVRSVVNYLSPVFVISTSTDSDFLKDKVAMLTAAQIGIGRQGSSLGNELLDWTRRLQNAAWAALQRAFINQSVEGTQIVEKDVPWWQRRHMSLLKERAVVPNV